MKDQLRAIRRSVHELLGSSKYSKPALNNLDAKLAKHLNFRDGFFIEAGANDGYCQSNTYYLEKMLGWRGILVEPIPQLFWKCKKNRSKSTVFNYALVSNEFQESSIQINLAGFSNLMSTAKDFTIDKEFEGKTLSNILVPAKTLESILDKYSNLPIIDFFSLDVEGYELDVIQGMNLRKYRPKIILVETRSLDEVNALLEPSYELVEQLTYHDYLYAIKDHLH